MRLILVRHGETRWNASGRYQGWEDPPLTSRGWITARGVGVALRARGVLRYALWSSDLARAATTARIACGRVPRLDRRLRELHFGAFGGRTYEENLQRYGPRFSSWIEDGGQEPPPGGESWRALSARTHRWLDELRRITPSGETVVAVTHGGAIRALLRPYVDDEAWPAPGGIVDLRWPGGNRPPSAYPCDVTV